MKSLWERCCQGEISLNDAVSAYASGSVEELVAMLKNEECCADALYIIAELPSRTSRRIWRQSLTYIHEPNEQTAFYVLDIFHTFVHEATPREFLLVLEATRLQSPVLFKKLFAITLTAPRSLLERVLALACENSSSAEHCQGLTLFLDDTGSEQRVSEALRSANLVARFYGCCAVGRNYPDNAQLLALLPEPIQRRLEIIRGPVSG